MTKPVPRRQAVHASSRGEDRLLELLQMLAGRSRLQIVLALLDGEKRVTDMGAVARITTVGASQHLAKLCRCGLAVARPAGSQVFYSLNANRLSELRRLTNAS
jgi:ArsR family transcriptional regulator